MARVAIVVGHTLMYPSAMLIVRRVPTTVVVPRAVVMIVVIFVAVGMHDHVNDGVGAGTVVTWAKFVL